MSSPLVTIVTPIYQGAAHLAACADSVRAQDHSNWIHLLVDNGSTDGTGDIARELADQDSRVRVISFDDHLPMLANWNRALAHVPEESTYVRQLNVDDRLAPHCLSHTIAAAERHPDIAIVSSFFLNGKRQLPKTRLSSESRIAGRDVVRNLFLGGADFLAQPSVLLLRREAIRHWPELYVATGFPPGLLSEPPLSQADKEGVLDTLLTSDLLFVPERLVLLREDADSATGYSWRVGAWHAGWMELLMRHGEKFLDQTEISRAMRRLTYKYIRSSVWRSLKGKSIFDAEFADFHRHSMAYLIPALRARGFEREAAVLNLFSRLVGTR
jgi:glycosyltransferase involved in cell wall biosynthesis